MKIECLLEKIKDSINSVEKITGKNLSLPVLKSVLLIAENNELIIRVTNLHVGIEIKIPVKVIKSGIIAVDANLFSNILSNLKNNKKILLEKEGNNLLIKTENSNLKLKTIPFDDFPTLPKIGDKKPFKISCQKLMNGFKSVMFSASNSDIKPEISSVYIYQKENNLFFVATDSFRLAEKKIKIKNFEDFSEVIIPIKNVQEIVRFFNNFDDEIEINVNNNQISFISPGIYFTTRIIDGSFPDYNLIIPKEFKTEVIILKNELINTLNIVNIFSNSFNEILLIIEPKNKKFILESKNNEIGENVTNVDAAISGEDIKLNINYRYLFECLQSIKKDSLILRSSEKNKPLIIKSIDDDSFLYLIMPMNR